MHFNTNYDFFKYNGKSRCASYDKFQAKRERPLWESLSRKFNQDDELIDFAVANCINNKKSIFEFDEDSYVSWRRKIESLDYHFRGEIEKLSSSCQENNISFSALFENENANHPQILKQLLSKQISIETFIILDYIIGFIKRFDSTLQDDLVWNETKTKIAKYRPFLHLNSKEKYRSIVMKIV